MIDINLNWKTIAAAVGGVLLLGYVAKRQAVAVVQETAQAIADPDNPVNSAANSVFETVSGNHVDTIGTWLYGVLHPDAGKAITAPTPINIEG